MEIRVVQSNKNVAICTNHQSIDVTKEQAELLVAGLVDAFGSQILLDVESPYDPFPSLSEED